MRARLVTSFEIAPEVRHFVFEALGAGPLSYTPGQFVSFVDVVNGRRVTRAYSIASPPEGNRFELCLNRVKDGLFSPHLFALEPGQEVEMTGPLGYFVPRDPFRDSVFVATGTGIAPFRAMLRSPHVAGSACDITLLFGARYEHGLLYRAEFEALAAARPAFRFWPAITRPDPSWAGRTGRVTEHLDQALAGRTDVDVYVCGLRAMVDAVRAMLRDRGFPKRQVITEKFD